MAATQTSDSEGDDDDAQGFSRTALTNFRSVMQLIIKVHRCHSLSTNSIKQSHEGIDPSCVDGLC